MKIDVIVPTFNRASVLERSIKSVLNQTFTSFFLHIIDDGSTDETSLLLKKYESHPQVKIYYQKNAGVSAARNFGVQNSRSPWISFLDSDDEWLPEKLSLQMKYLDTHPECSFLHSEEEWIRNGVRVNPKVKHKKSSEDLFVRSLDFCLVSPSTVIMKRDLFVKHGGFNETFTVCEDYDLWLKILLTGEMGFLNIVVTKKYGGHPDQLSTQFVAMDYWRIKSLVHLYQQKSADLIKRQQIKEVAMKKSEILLKGYIKHQNQKAHDEITDLLKLLS